MRNLLVGLGWVICVGLLGLQQAGSPAPGAQSREALQAAIAGLKVEKVAWREIAWRDCLLEGLRESRQQKKPVILWVFIDRPVDDQRC